MAIVLPSGAKATASTASLPVSMVFRSVPPATSQSRAVPSAPAVATSLPSGAKATASTASPCPWSVAFNSPDAVSQSRAVRSPLAVASVLPSGANATPRTGPPCPENVRSSLPVATSHIFTALSCAPAASVLPSGANATALAAAANFFRTWLTRPSAASRILTVRSDSAVASVLPSGANATPRMPQGELDQRRLHPPGDVEESQLARAVRRPLLGARGRRQHLAVAREGDAPDPPRRLRGEVGRLLLEHRLVLGPGQHHGAGSPRRLSRLPAPTPPRSRRPTPRRAPGRARLRPIGLVRVPYEAWKSPTSARDQTKTPSPGPCDKCHLHRNDCSCQESIPGSRIPFCGKNFQATDNLENSLAFGHSSR